MSRPLSSVLRKELANLEKDDDSHKSAMKALKSYVKDLDIRAIPSFLAQISETKETGVSSGEYTISLVENVVRFHGSKIVSHTESIMTSVIKTLAMSEGSFPLQQACSKVVSAMARYGIDPSTAIDKRRNIIHSLCNSLSDSLLDSQECLASGSALCLRALVDCDNWRCASDEMVNRVCQNVAVALEMKFNETSSHMALVMALAKNNPFIVEAYARLLVRSALRIMDSGVVEGNSQKRLLAIQMLNFLMKNLDYESMDSEMDLIIAELEKCQSDKMHFVRMAASESMITAKKIAGDKACRSSGSVTASNFSSRNFISASERSLKSASAESPRNGACDLLNGDLSVNYKLKNRGKVNGNDLMSDFEGSYLQDSPLAPCGDLDEEFIGVQHGNQINGFLSRTPSPQRSRSRAFASARSASSDSSEEQQNGFFRTPCSRNPNIDATHDHQHGFVHDLFDELIEERELFDSRDKQQSEGENNSVSSVHDAQVDDTSTQISSVFEDDGVEDRMIVNGTKRGGSRRVMRCGLSLVSVVVAGLASFVWLLDDQDQTHYWLVPT